MAHEGDRDTGDGDGTDPAERTAEQRAQLDRLHAEADRLHAQSRAHRRDPGGRTAGGPGGACWAELDRLHAEGERLHAEDLRLRAERDRGVIDQAAHDGFLAALAAHRAALQRFRAGG
jgi:hypothetical protein